MKGGLVLILAGVFVGAQIIKGGALDRIFGSSSPGAPNGSKLPNQLPNLPPVPATNPSTGAGINYDNGSPFYAGQLGPYGSNPL